MAFYYLSVPHLNVDDPNSEDRNPNQRLAKLSISTRFLLNELTHNHEMGS